MPPPLLTLQDISLQIGSHSLLEDAGLVVGAGDRICLVGRNGAGKSTLLRIAAGLLPPDAGRRFVQPGATVRYLEQEPDLSGYPSTLAVVEAGLGTDAAMDKHRALYLLQRLGLTGDEEPGVLSGGEARRVALAAVLAPEPDILLLDEPTNHLDLPGIAWLEAELSGLRSGIVTISHDRRLLQAISRTTVWLDRGLVRTLDQGFAGFEAWRDSVLEQEATEHHKLARKIVAEEDWLRYGVTARRKRNVKRLADLHRLRAQRREARQTQGKLRLSAAEADLSGRLVIVADGISKSFDGHAVVRDLSTRVMRGDRIGIIGANGAGKTTLLKLLTGELAPDQGEVRLGTNLARLTLDQRREALDPAQTLADTLTGGSGDTVLVNGQRRHVVSYMKDFLFSPNQAGTPVGVLSGGERGRLMLARTFAQPSNLMVLDEPTNDLDLETLDLLQEQLADYPGTVLLVSHDRDFLDRVVTSVLVAAGDGRWLDYAGGFSDMLAQGGPNPAGAAVAGSAAAAAERTVAAKGRSVAIASSPPPSRPRLSFKEQYALQHLPERIAALEAEIARLRERLADPDLYASDPKAFAAATGRLAAAQGELAAAEDEWLMLEMRRAD
ncbi:MAG TPA: ABC-F family ATP-binding cassette domain-containing protein [Acetobacteraceae bacterium]|nr:ABC-F family ATP-binding cassette domain-containing protein [Acetobacteraceae bacterium]